MNESPIAVNADWTIPFSDFLFSEMLFSFGDKSQWLVTTRHAAVGEKYDNVDRDILRSSLNDDPYQAKWKNIDSNNDHPVIGVKDVDVCNVSESSNCILYWGNNGP